MNTKLTLFLGLLVLGSLGIVGTYFARSYISENDQVATSDASRTQETITIGIDNWVGYIPLCGKELRKRLHHSGILLKCEDDNADYPARMENLRKGKIDFAVATVDSFILNGAPDFPGTIIMVIDESKGGDALIARKSKLSKIDELRDKKNFKIAFTPSSPSEHLLKSIASHFDITSLRDKKGKWRMEVGGAQEARKKLESGEVDAAVMWEPEVSKALGNDSFIKLLGTEDTRKLIVDILVVNRDFAKKSPERVNTLLSQYFRVLKLYRDQPELLLEEIKDATRLDSKMAQALVGGVRWINLNENARDWFGVSVGGSKSTEGLVNTIESTVEILLDHNDFGSSPLPDRDPYRLQYRNFIESALKDSSQFGAVAGEGDVPNLHKNFETLTPDQWDALMEIGTLKIRPINFQSGTSRLGEQGVSEIDMAAANLTHYPNFRVLVRGHTGLRGDAPANRALSLERAEAVRKYLLEKHGLEEQRVRAVGLGSERPLMRDPGESDRSYEYRLPRVELSLVAEAL